MNALGQALPNNSKGEQMLFDNFSITLSAIDSPSSAAHEPNQRPTFAAFEKINYGSAK